MSEKIYLKFANYYDLIYSFKDYKTESKRLDEIIRSYKKSNGKELLEIACGTGNYLIHLNKKYNVTGLDINKLMLSIAKKKVPVVKLRQGDMRTFNLPKQYDVVICLFSSIAYMTDYRNLKLAISNFVRHLKPGGIIIFELFVSPGRFINKAIHLMKYDSNDIKIARMNTTERKGMLAKFKFHFLVAQKGKVKHFTETHQLGLFEYHKVMKTIKQCGLKAYYVKKGLIKRKGLYIGVKL